MLATLSHAPSAYVATAEPDPHDDETYSVEVLRTGELVIDGLTREQAQSKARAMNTGATMEELVVWRVNRQQRFAQPRITVNAGQLVKEPEPEPKELEGNEKSNEDLFREYQAGSCEAFDELYGRYQTILLRYIKRRTFGRDGAEDILQDALLVVMQTRRQVTNFDALIYATIRVQCLQYRKRLGGGRRGRAYREHQAAVRAAYKPHLQRDQLLHELVSLEQIEWVRIALAQLDDRDSDILRMRFRDDLSGREIAERMGHPRHCSAYVLQPVLDRLVRILVSRCRIVSGMINNPSKWWNQPVTQKQPKSHHFGKTQRAILIVAYRCYQTGEACDSVKLLHEIRGFPCKDGKVDIQRVGQQRYNEHSTELACCARQLHRGDLIFLDWTRGEFQLRLNDNGLRVADLLQPAAEGKAVQPCR